MKQSDSMPGSTDVRRALERSQKKLVTKRRLVLMSWIVAIVIVTVTYEIFHTRLNISHIDETNSRIGLPLIETPHGSLRHVLNILSTSSTETSTPTTTTTTQPTSTTSQPSSTTTSLSTTTTTTTQPTSTTSQSSSTTTSLSTTTTTTTQPTSTTSQSSSTTTSMSTTTTTTTQPTSTTTQTSTSSVTTPTTTVQTSTTTRPPCTAEFKSSHLMRPGMTGRIGNQLFELCTLMATADEYCYTPVVLPTEVGLFSVFNVHNLVVMEYNVSDFPRGVGEPGAMKYGGKLLKGQTLDVNFTVGGYHQSYKYFHYKKDLIRSSFVFKDEIKEDVWRFFANYSLELKTKVGIHVRRGDFADPHFAKLGFWSSGANHVRKAVAYFNDHPSYKNVVFVIVSDDIPWCRENLHITNSYFSPFNDEGRDLCILTQCDHNVVTSGSYSWMGAWLNETGTVIYDKMYPEPDSWLAEQFIKEDYYPWWWIGF